MGDLDINKYNEWPIFEFVRIIPELNSKIETELKITLANKVIPKKGQKIKIEH